MFKNCTYQSQINEPRNCYRQQLQDLQFAEQKNVVHLNENKSSRELQNIKSLFTYLQRFNQLISERQVTSQGFWLPQNVDTEDCTRQKLVHLLILSKVYSKYDFKRIPQSIFFQPFAIIFQFQHTYSGQIFPFNSHQVQLSHLWAVLRTAEGSPLSSGKSNRALRPKLRIRPKGGSDLGVFAEHKGRTFSHTIRVPLHRRCFPISKGCHFHASPNAHFPLSVLYCLISSGS